ncbi:protein FlbE [soil metagenome]
MSTSVPTKFNFDTVFDAAGDVTFALPKIKRLFTAAEMEEVRIQAFADGERSTSAIADVEAAHALTAIAQAAQKALGALAQVAHEHRTASADLALAVGRKIADAALERFPEAPVTAALLGLARELEAAPRLLVRAEPSLVERLQAILEETAHNCGLSGQILVKADHDLPLAAFVLDWGDGRAAFDPEEAGARVAAALETALAAEGLHAEPMIPTSEADNG